MAVFSSPAQGAAVLTAFFLPIITYLYLTRTQHQASSSSSTTATSPPSAGPLPPPTKVTALYIHPIKSCHGISVQSARLLPTGLDLGKPPPSISPAYHPKPPPN
jgi:hypothetical protein